VNSKKGNAIKTDASTGKSKYPGSGIDPLLNIDTGVALKTFNQYNMTLSKVTGIDAAIPAISTEYELVKNSLPGDHLATSFTPFHQISETRLSFAYCNNFIDNNLDFKALNYVTITPESVATKLLEKFIGVRPAKEFEIYDKFYETVLKIMNNDAGVDDNNIAIGKLIPTSTGAIAKTNLTKLACTAILSSSEFTTL
jgi:hypothetical protein